MRTTNILLPLLILFLLQTACQQNSNPSPGPTPALEADDTEADRLLPKLLRGLPVGLVGAHDPNPVNAVFEDSMYVWKHNTTIRSVVGDVKLIEFGSFVWTDAGWYHRLADTPEQFAQVYDCPSAALKAGVVYTDPTSWRRQETLTGGDALWYYIVEDANGKRWKGTALVETEAVVEPAVRDSVTYTFQPGRSSLQWTGYGEVGDYSLSGQLNVRSGHLRFAANAITHGEVVADMRSMYHEDANLLEHLKGPDFFDVEHYTEARFSATGSTPIVNDTCTVMGSLTIRGTTNPVKFPARISRQGDRCTVTGSLELDRTRFGIKYGSNSFFDNLGDQAISNTMRVKVDLVGTN
ncbi:MAG: YceI family protein [Flavobacteriales bacterium]|jgi:polyisoprenoid-binding protein YceI|nr:YceI family protein [Flavobacteriales bacterium]